MVTDPVYRTPPRTRPRGAEVEELLHEPRETYTIVVVTQNMQQAAGVAEHRAFSYMGELVERDETNVLFTKPGDPRTEDYITGRSR